MSFRPWEVHRCVFWKNRSVGIIVGKCGSIDASNLSYASLFFFTKSYIKGFFRIQPFTYTRITHVNINESRKKNNIYVASPVDAYNPAHRIESRRNSVLSLLLTLEFPMHNHNIEECARIIVDTRFYQPFTLHARAHIICAFHTFQVLRAHLNAQQLHFSLYIYILITECAS